MVGKFATIILLVGCQGSAPPVKPHDAGPDSPPGPEAGCGLTTAGELLDWDSTAATAAPIAGATLVDRDDPTRTTTTGADGTYTLCIAAVNFGLIDVTPPADDLPGVIFAKRDVVAKVPRLSARTMTAARRDTFFTQLGATYDPAAGQVLVHFNGPHKATIDHTPAGTQAYNADAWAAGDTGDYVFFGNVALGATANTVVGSDAAGVIGGAAIPLVPGSISYVELFVP